MNALDLQPARTGRRRGSVVAVIALVFLGTACNGQINDAIQSRSPSLPTGRPSIGLPSPSIGVPSGSLKPTQSPTRAPTQAPTTQPPTTQPPTQAPTSPPTVQPTSQPTLPTVQPTIVVTVTIVPTAVSASPAAGATSSGNTWIWLLIAAAVIALIVALVLRGRSGKDAWKDQAKLAISNGDALYRQLVDELSLARAGGTVPAGLAESQRMVDVLGGNLAQLSQGTLEVGVVTALQNLREKLGGLRASLEPMGAGVVVAPDTLGRATQQLTAFHSALGAFRDTVIPPESNMSATDWSG